MILDSGVAEAQRSQEQIKYEASEEEEEDDDDQFDPMVLVNTVIETCFSSFYDIFISIFLFFYLTY